MNHPLSIDQISSGSFDESSEDTQFKPISLQNEIKASSLCQKYLLTSFFKAWNFYITHRKSILQDEMKFIRWRIWHIQKIFFRKLIKNYEIYIKFHNLKPNLMILKHFSLWINYLEIHHNIKLCYCEVVMKRREIYQHFYLKKWHRALSLKRQYDFYSRNDDQILGQKIIRAFQTYIVKKREFVKIVKTLQEIHLHNTFIKWYKAWRYARMTRYIQRKKKFHLRHVYFSIWYDLMNVL